MYSPDRMRRFYAKLTPEPNSGCWLWFAGSNEHGYGVFWNGRKLDKAHRFAFKAFVDPALSDDLDVLHKCDTPACVNPDHLFAGTAKANVDDMWAKSRATVLRHCGTAQTQAKLNDKAVADIRCIYTFGAASQRELARSYGVCQSVIWNVIHRRTWREKSGVVVETGRGK